MDLKDILVKTKEREKGGSIASGRLRYQKDWTLFKILDLYSKQEDYLVLCEFHDDVVVIDSQTTPQKIDFYQIKTKGVGNWSKTSLVKREKDKNGENKGMSILGKMYFNEITFPDTKKTLNFISNARFLLILDGKKSLVEDACLETCDEKKDICKFISNEFSVEEIKDEFCKYTFFCKSPISLDDSETHTKGVVSSFLDKNLKEGVKYTTSLVYNTLIDEIRRKGDYMGSMKDFEEVKNNKGISNKFIDDLLRRIGITKNFNEIWVEASSALNKENINVDDLKEIYRAWKEYEIKLMDETNNLHKSVCNEVEEIVKKYLEIKKPEKLTPFLDECLQEYKKKNKNLMFSDFYIKAVIIDKYYEL